METSISITFNSTLSKLLQKANKFEAKKNHKLVGVISVDKYEWQNSILKLFASSINRRQKYMCPQKSKPSENGR